MSIYVPGRLVLANDYIPVDPDFANVSLLLHGDGANGSTTIIDSSPSPKTVTAVGDAQISTAQSKFGGTSIAFDGSGDSLTIPGSPEFSFSGDFTIELWAYPTNSTTTNQEVIRINTFSNGVLIRYRSIAFSDDVYVQNVSKIFLTPTINANQWNHIALTRSGTIVRAFVNGHLLAQTLIVTGTVNTTMGGVTIGSSYTGYIDEFRITKGIARYTANFTPPTAPFPDIASR